MKKINKLALSKQTIARLSAVELTLVGGGNAANACVATRNDCGGGTDTCACTATQNNCGGNGTHACILSRGAC